MTRRISWGLIFQWTALCHSLSCRWSQTFFAGVPVQFVFFLQDAIITENKNARRRYMILWKCQYLVKQVSNNDCRSGRQFRIFRRLKKRYHLAVLIYIEFRDIDSTWNNVRMNLTHSPYAMKSVCTGSMPADDFQNRCLRNGRQSYIWNI
jgi:hypothetical protein